MSGGRTEARMALRVAANGDGLSSGAPALCVLASGSRGNCTALRIAGREGERARLLLIDAGLSVRRTRALLEARGHGLEDVAGVLFTHFDTDHCQAPVVRALESSATIWAHRRHRGRAQRAGLLTHRSAVFEDEEVFSPMPGVEVRSLLASHDELGVALFRIDLQNGSALGHMTDAGRATERVVEHLRGVDTLAIESNYCPEMQRASARPEYLKKRIMGGSGHLSNEQCAEAVGRIGPRERVVLLHLSEECNTADRASVGHVGKGYRLTVSSQTESTEWVRVGAPGIGRARGEVVVRKGVGEGMLF